MKDVTVEHIIRSYLTSEIKQKNTCIFRRLKNTQEFLPKTNYYQQNRLSLCSNIPSHYILEPTRLLTSQLNYFILDPQLVFPFLCYLHCIFTPQLNDPSKTCSILFISLFLGTYLFLHLSIYLFIFTTLGLCCCVWATCQLQSVGFRVFFCFFLFFNFQNFIIGV